MKHQVGLGLVECLIASTLLISGAMMIMTLQLQSREQLAVQETQRFLTHQQDQLQTRLQQVLQVLPRLSGSTDLADELAEQIAPLNREVVRNAVAITANVTFSIEYWAFSIEADNAAQRPALAATGNGISLHCTYSATTASTYQTSRVSFVQSHHGSPPYADQLKLNTLRVDTW